METENTPAANPPKLLDMVRDRIRVKRYSIRTEKQYAIKGAIKGARVSWHSVKPITPGIGVG